MDDHADLDRLGVGRPCGVSTRASQSRSSTRRRILPLSEPDSLEGMPIPGRVPSWLRARLVCRSMTARGVRKLVRGVGGELELALPASSIGAPTLAADDEGAEEDEEKRTNTGGSLK